MKKKNSIPIKWMLGILIILMAVAYWTNQSSKNMTTPEGSHVSLQNNFFQFLANLIGIHSQPPSSNASNENNTPNQNNPISGQMGSLATSNQLSPNSIIAGNALGGANSGTSAENNVGGNSAGTNVDQETGNLNPASNSEINAENTPNNNPTSNSETNADQETGNIAENNSEFNTENPSGINAENNPENNSEINGDNNSGINTENNPGANAETTQENNSGSNSGGNSGGGSGNSLGNNSGCNPGCYGGCNPSCDSECVPGCSTLNSQGSNLPTINPIPSDNAASQSIAQQNQNSNSLTALITARQTLAAEVRQSAEATKYQTVTSDSIAPADKTPAPEDTVTKIKSHELIFL